ncbi:MAG: hypothetical protein ACKVON_14655 [Beijerinckiaceae bacterium]
MSIKSIALAAAIAALPVLALGTMAISPVFAKGQGGGNAGGVDGGGDTISARSFSHVPNSINKRPARDEDRGCFTLIDNRHIGRVVRGSCLPVL